MAKSRGGGGSEGWGGCGEGRGDKRSRINREWRLLRLDRVSLYWFAILGVIRSFLSCVLKI